jgi:hypothetical protein
VARIDKAGDPGRTDGAALRRSGLASIRDPAASVPLPLWAILTRCACEYDLGDTGHERIRRDEAPTTGVAEP